VILNKMSLGRADRALKKEFRRYEHSLELRRFATDESSYSQVKTSA
jgi:hypothetical protein